MFDLPDPVGMYEQAKNAGLEREIAEDFLGVAYSGFINLVWGLRKIPIFGPAFAAQALSIYFSLKNGKLFQEGKLRITVNKSLLDPDLLSQYQTEWINKEAVKNG